MESTQEVEVELEEIATAKENENKEGRQTKEEEGNVYSTLTQPSDHVYGEPSLTKSYTVNEDISRKVRVYRTISLVLLAVCVLLLFLVLVLFVKLTEKQSCQTDDAAVVQECNLKKCEDVYQESLFRERSHCSCFACDVGWLKFENSCYFLSKERLSWHESRNECQRKGGDLAIINNKRLQSYLTTNGNMHYWIGLNQVGTNEWIWNNNTVLTVRYWGQMFSNGDCALLAANEPPEQSWHQSICTLYLQYICQITKS